MDASEINYKVSTSKAKNDTDWDRMNEKFKMSIFGVIHILLKDDEEPSWLFTFFSILEVLQNLVFPYNKIVIKHSHL